MGPAGKSLAYIVSLIILHLFYYFYFVSSLHVVIYFTSLHFSLHLILKFHFFFQCAPMVSAYASHNGSEPSFTNFAKIKEEPSFIDTLDYIFLSKHWAVHQVLQLPTKEAAEMEGPMPTKDQPSDHLLLSAEISIRSEL